MNILECCKCVNTWNCTFFICKYITNRPYINASGANSQLTFVFFILYFHFIVSLIFIFSIMWTLNYPDYILKSQWVQIIEVPLCIPCYPVREVYNTCIPFPYFLFKLPITQTVFDFPWRFELSRVNCNNMTAEKSLFSRINIYQIHFPRVVS